MDKESCKDISFDFIYCMGKLRTLLALIPSLFFCIRYLPFKQAIKIPIIIYNPHLYCLKGKIQIISPKITFGMIRLGLFVTNQYPNSGIRWYNQGTIVFKGNVAIGANSAITLLRKDSYVEFGANFGNVTSLRLNCDYRIIFKENVRIGWDVSIMDSSMHRLKNIDGEFISKGYDEIYIGANTWIGSQCIVLQGARLPDYTVVAAHSLVNSHVNTIPSYSLIGGSPAKFIKNGVWRDINDDKIII